MAFPVVEGRSSGIQGSNATSHSITLPTGIVAGEMLVVVFSVDGNPTCSDGSGLWTKLNQASYSTVVTGAVFTKRATGSDSLTITTSASEQSTHIAFRISTVDFVATVTPATGDSTNSNPPNLNMGVAKDFLWIATRSGDGATVATVAPTNYSNLQTRAGGTSGASSNTAERSLNAASEDPGVFTSATEQWVAFTLVVSPGTILTLRPNAAGDETWVGVQYPSSTFHWDKVDEAVADDATTYIRSFAANWQRDLYNIPNHTTETGTINSVIIYARAITTGTPDQTSLIIGLKIGGTAYSPTEVTVTTSWVTYSRTWTINPQTGVAWTWAQIDALQIGVSLRESLGGGAIETDCTQVYVEVTYTALTAVGDTIQKIWNIRQAVPDTSQYIYHIRALASDTVQQIWNVKTYIGDTIQAIWNVKTFIGKAVQKIWHTRFALGKPIQLVHNVRQAIGDTSQYIWNVLTSVTAVGDTFQLVWHIKTSIGDTVQQVWNTRYALGDAIQNIWHIRQAITQTRQAVWNVRATISDTIQSVWNTLGIVGKANQAIWNVRFAIGDTSQLIWNVLSTAVTAVGDTVQFIWHIRQAVSDTSQKLWNIRQAISDTIRAIWNTRVDYIFTFTDIADPISFTDVPDGIEFTDVPDGITFTEVK